MSPRDIFDLFLQNPQIRTAIAGPPPCEEHPLIAAEAARKQRESSSDVTANDPSSERDSRQ